MAGVTRATISSGLAPARGSTRRTWRSVAMPIRNPRSIGGFVVGDCRPDQGEDGVAALVAVDDLRVAAHEHPDVVMQGQRGKAREQFGEAGR